MRYFLTLILIALGACFGGLLFAEEYPIQFGGNQLVLPEGWSHVYDPPEVLIRVLADTDSSFQLLKILDGKDELAPLLEDYLAGIKQLPEKDRISVQREFDAIVSIYSPGKQAEIQAARTDPVREEPKSSLADLESWITAERTSQSLREPLHKPALQTFFQKHMEPYRSAYLFSGKSALADPVLIHGFRQPGSVFGSLLYEGFHESFYQEQVSTFGTDYIVPAYPYEVTLSDIQGGLGGYEHRFARGSLKKNRLFGVPELYLDFDFLFQNGWWEEQNSAQTAMKYYLSLPLGISSLELEYADYASDLAMTQLKPEYWQKTLFTIDHRYRQIYTAWKNPWLNLALRNVRETAKSEKFAQALKSDFLQLQAYKSAQLGSLGAKALYEHLFTKANYHSGGADYKDLAQLELEYAQARLKAATQASLLDFERIRLDGQIALHWNSFSTGIAIRQVIDASPAETLVPDIYQSDHSLPRVDTRCKQDLGLLLGWQADAGSAINLILGQKNIQSVADTSSTAFMIAKDLLYATLGAEIKPSWGPWELNWQPGITLQNGTEGLRDQPALEYHSHLKIRRVLPYDNALFAGFAIYGHSPYTSATKPVFEVGTSALADVWAGVQISNRFELMVSLKNISDGNLYGVYPLPLSLHASLRWFYLN